MKTVLPTRIVILCAALAVFLAAPAPAQLLPMPALKVPDGLGVNIHFTNPKPTELQAMADAGFKWLRVDLRWDATETRRGIYNFSAYDNLTLAANQYGLKIIFILCYNNPLYNGGYSPSTASSQQAYANWAVAAVARYQGFGHMWELYNEPNGNFWTSSGTLTVTQKAEAYTQMAIKAAATIKTSFPNERVIGPGAGYFDGWNADFPATISYLQTCLQQGAFAKFDGITVHPYRTVQPEHCWSDYNTLGNLINTTFSGPRPPILSGEWGYTSTWFNGNQTTKAKYLSRSILHNYLCGIPLSMVYDWVSGTDPNEPEQNYGIVSNYNRNVASPVIPSPPPPRLPRRQDHHPTTHRLHLRRPHRHRRRQRLRPQIHQRQPHPLRRLEPLGHPQRR